MPEEIFTTHHLALAATLSYLGYEMEIKGQHPRKSFCFKMEDKESLEKIINDFWKGDLTVEPSRYYMELKNVKVRLKESP